MSDIDLTEVAEFLFRWNSPSDPYFVIRGRSGGVDVLADDPYVPIVAAVLAAAAPLIEAAVWNAAADFVDAQRDEEFGDDLRQVRDRLRSIARGAR